MFSRDTLTFLNELARNNNRDWFNENKQRYEDEVRGPALDFIRLMDERLDEISPYFLAVAKKVGGSLMRPYRDTRFSRDKTPYKLNVGIQFRHELGKDVHAPGFYVHIEPEESFLGVGIWRPDSPTLGKIRDAIVQQPSQWLDVRDYEPFAEMYALSGDALKTWPRGYDRDHPLIADLRRKDFIGISTFDSEQITHGEEFVDFVVDGFERGAPLMGFLCQALGLRY